jgi:RNA polymerase sigma-70 factor, ECF subfamily
VALRQEFARLHDDVDLERDRVLVERCQAGDSGAFGSLYARYYERLLRFCLRRLHDRHEAEDAAQEAFAKAWKALPNFGGDRHFYPWLTVIAGNVCTDILRRRSRSTPTADTELSARLPAGAAANATADEVIIAGVDGELVHKALDRLSSRHRDVLAMREESGWTYQQIADHEGVEIGTIETLLWRARQALKREFNVLAESKGALAGFLAGAGALVRTGWARTAHRGASLAAGGSGSGSMRNAFAGVAVTSAAVAAAFIAPHALDPGPAGRVALPASTSAQTGGHYAARSSLTPNAASTLRPGGPTAGGTPPSVSASANSTAGAGGIAVPTTDAVGGLLPSGGSPLTPVTGLSGVTQPVGNIVGPIASGTSNALAQSPVGAAVNSATDGLSNGLSNGLSSLGATVGGLGAAVNGLGKTLGSALTSLAGTPATGATATPTTATPTTTTLPPLPSIVAPLTNTVTSTVQNLLGQG